MKQCCSVFVLEHKSHSLSFSAPQTKSVQQIQSLWGHLFHPPPLFHSPIPLLLLYFSPSSHLPPSPKSQPSLYSSDSRWTGGNSWLSVTDLSSGSVYFLCGLFIGPTVSQFPLREKSIISPHPNPMPVLSIVHNGLIMQPECCKEMYSTLGNASIQVKGHFLMIVLLFFYPRHWLFRSIKHLPFMLIAL